MVSNNPSGFVSLIEVCTEKLKEDMPNVFFCFEDTGRYSKLLSVFLQDTCFRFSTLNALDIKRSMGLTRGKSDKKDARLIALYAWRKREEIEPTILAGPVFDQLKRLLTLREKLIKHRTAYKNAGKDLYDCYRENENSFIKECQNRMLDNLNTEIEKTENEIHRIINENENFSANFKLLGKVLAMYFITLSENFQKFDNPRKFACYAGIAPFEYSSGTSIKGKTRVHPCANRQMKSLLNLAAMASIQ